MCCTVFVPLSSFTNSLNSSCIAQAKGTFYVRLVDLPFYTTQFLICIWSSGKYAKHSNKPMTSLQTLVDTARPSVFLNGSFKRQGEIAASIISLAGNCCWMNNSCCLLSAVSSNIIESPLCYREYLLFIPSYISISYWKLSIQKKGSR